VHVTTVTQLFEVSAQAQDSAPYADGYRLFSHSKPWAICAKSLLRGPLSTKTPARELKKSQDLDERDDAPAKTIEHLFIHSLQMQEQRGRVKLDGKKHCVSEWRLSANSK
jgi:hypothetical protein